MRTTQSGAVVVAFAILLPTAVGLAQDMSGHDREMIRPASELQFKDAGPGVSKALLWGDPTTGPYGTINRFAKGTLSPLHTHSNDIRIIILSGTFVYDSGTGEKRLGPGSYLLQPAGLKHRAGAGEDADCVFFEEGSGAFDLIVAP